MSRLKKFTHSLVSGYVQIGTNVIYTLASVPLALHYLSTDEFGLWQVAMTVAGYLLLIDFGITNASMLTLIDHKDDPAGGMYGAVIKISSIIFLIQGFAVAALGSFVSYWLPGWMNIPERFQHTLFLLAAGQCTFQGVFFITRIFWNVTIAHQRFDLYNYAQTGALIVQFGALWFSFHEGAGVFSVLIASGTALTFTFCFGLIVATRLRFLPPAGAWGKFDWKLFKVIFFFGGEQFLLVVGGQLLNASQVLIISHTLGLTAATVWAVAIKPFTMAQQLVGRIWDFAVSALCEMIVHREQQRLLRRFRDVTVFSVVAGIFMFGGIAVCNESFLQIWLKKPDVLQAIKNMWSPLDNFLLATWFIIVSMTRCQVGFTTLVKQIGRMRYVYFLEGITFVLTAILAAPRFGIAGVIGAAILSDIVWSGIYGTWRTARYFNLSLGAILRKWLARPLIYFGFFATILIATHFMTESLHPLVRILLNAGLAGVAGLFLLWLVALNKELKEDLKQVLTRLKSRLRGYFSLP